MTEIDEWLDEIERTPGWTSGEKVTRLIALVRRYREALKPLAAIADVYGPDEDADFVVWEDRRMWITVGDCRRAAAALRAKPHD